MANIYYLKELLTSYAKKVRKLHLELYLEPFSVSSEADAKRYLQMTNEYKFYCQLFADLEIFGFTNKNFDINSFIEM